MVWFVDLCCFYYRLPALNSNHCEKGCYSCIKLLALLVISCEETSGLLELEIALQVFLSD